MDPRNAYKFCPKCGNKIVDKQDFLECSSCGFHFYINSIPCNSVIIENERHEILLVKRKVEPRAGTWDLPGGFLKPGENFFDSVKREIREELHVEIEVTGIVGIYEDTYLFQNILNPTLMIATTAKIISGNLKADDDVSDYRYFPKQEVLQQELSFQGIQKSLKDYLRRNINRFSRRHIVVGQYFLGDIEKYRRCCFRSINGGFWSIQYD